MRNSGSKVSAARLGQPPNYTPAGGAAAARWRGSFPAAMARIARKWREGKAPAVGGASPPRRGPVLAMFEQQQRQSARYTPARPPSRRIQPAEHLTGCRRSLEGTPARPRSCRQRRHGQAVWPAVKRARAPATGPGWTRNESTAGNTCKAQRRRSGSIGAFRPPAPLARRVTVCSTVTFWFRC